MIFRRSEIKKVCRHEENVSSPEEVRDILSSIFENKVTFGLRAKGMSPLEECSVIELQDDFVSIISSGRKRVRLRLQFGDIEEVDVIFDRGLSSSEEDDGGRWSRILI